MKIVKAKADWCAPCRVLSTMLDGFNKCPIEELNVDLEPEKATEYGIRALPTLILFDDDGVELWRKTGVINKLELENIVKSFEK